MTLTLMLMLMLMLMLTLMEDGADGRRIFGPASARR